VPFLFLGKTMEKIIESNFIKSKIDADIKSGKVAADAVVIRFPPEPNGYLHLGHAKSIVMHKNIMNDFNAKLRLRFDDTNPEKETEEYVENIKNDFFWLLNKPIEIVWASNYFDKIYECATYLIKNGLAYVDFTSLEEMKELRGNFGKPGIASVYRNVSPEVNLSIFEDMKSGKYEDGHCVLRLKIDLSHGNMNMRDPVIYRIKHAYHHNTKDKWCIYPMYDFAHPISDAIEKVTHSLCTLEFEDHRPLYDWLLDKCYPILGHISTQTEFAKLEVKDLVLSKRKLNNLVVENKVSGWTASNMPTLSGLRNRGFNPTIIEEYMNRCGVSKANSVIEPTLLSEVARELLNPIALRTMAIIKPVKLVLDNLDESIDVIVSNHPKDVSKLSRTVKLTKELFIDADDVRLEAEKDFWRVYPGNWVRLKHAINILVKSVEKIDGNIVVHAEVDYDSRDMKKAKVKAKGMIHWLSPNDSMEKTANFYHNLFDSDGNFNDANLEKKTILVHKDTENNSYYEFERVGYFWVKDEIHHLSSLKF
jgi:glutaminyl-tRNA synthetase